ncbi:MAG: DUF4870 domain-containing protein [Deltaproteobacteria bacterium]|nr:DUF4870 domain-containing protein [Deltaproteobacteria bacterium]
MPSHTSERTVSNDLQHLEKTSIGLEVCYTAPLTYLAGWLTGLLFLFIEPENKYVRFHAAQSLAWFGGLSLTATVLGIIPIIGMIAGGLIGLVGLFSWVLMIYKAWDDSRTGTPLRLPIAADIADKIIATLDD